MVNGRGTMITRVIAGVVVIVFMTICEIRTIVENVLSGRLKNPPEKIYEQYSQDRWGGINFWFSTDVSGKNRISDEMAYRFFGAYRYKSEAEGYFTLSHKRKGKWTVL